MCADAGVAVVSQDPVLAIPDLSVDLDTISEIIDPDTFRRAKSMRDYCLMMGDGENEADAAALWAEGTAIETACIKARKIVNYYQAKAPEALLNNPAAVHVNMLRGTIAKPSIENIINLYGADALRKALLQSDCELSEDLQELQKLSEVADQGDWSVSGVRRRVDAPSCVIIDSPSCPTIMALPTGNGAQALEALRDAKFAVAAVKFVRKLLGKFAMVNQ